MVLRSGIIIPFQFRDKKKLLMIGAKNENRDLCIFDLKNVVRAAFGVCNFEFRNKKIGFIIPDDLLMSYLAQRHDLTNFVIEIRQVFEPDSENVRIKTENCHCSADRLLDGTESSCNHNAYHHASSLMAEQSAEVQRHRLAHKTHIDTGSASDSSSTPSAPQIKEDFNDNVERLEPLSEPTVAASSQAYQHEQAQPSYMHQQLQLPPHGHWPGNEHDQTLQRLYAEHNLLDDGMTSSLVSGSVAGVSTSYSGSSQPAQRYRLRKERMSRYQKQMYVQFLKQNPVLSQHRRNDPMLEPLWQKLTNILNEVPNGAVKKLNEWKHVFDSWRYRVFLFTRHNASLSEEQKLDRRNFKSLTLTDKMAYALWRLNPDTAPTDIDMMPVSLITRDDEQELNYSLANSNND